MKTKRGHLPVGPSYTILKQVCRLLPSGLVDEQRRTFQPWRHTEVLGPAPSHSCRGTSGHPALERRPPSVKTEPVKAPSAAERVGADLARAAEKTVAAALGGSEKGYFKRW